METQMQEIMESYNNYLFTLNKNIPPLVENFRDGKIDESLKKVTHLFEGVEWLVSVNKKLNELGYTNTIDIIQVNTILAEIIDAITNKDYHLVADLLEYELLELLSNMNEYNIN